MIYIESSGNISITLILKNANFISFAVTWSEKPLSKYTSVATKIRFAKSTGNSGSLVWLNI